MAEANGALITWSMVNAALASKATRAVSISRQIRLAVIIGCHSPTTSSRLQKSAVNYSVIQTDYTSATLKETELGGISSSP